MLKKTLPLVGLLLLCIFFLGASKTSGASNPPVTISVIFPNGQNTETETAGTNFTVSFNINSTLVYPQGIGYYSIAIHWDPSALALQHGTPADITEGAWMPSFGSTFWPGVLQRDINNTNGTIGVITDSLLSYIPGATGNGTMFKVAFTALTNNPMANITILNPNTESYMLNGTLTEQVIITHVYDGTVTVVPEFLASALLPLFLVTTTIAIAAATATSRKRRILSKIS